MVKPNPRRLIQNKVATTFDGVASGLENNILLLQGDSIEQHAAASSKK
jgi:hypothetical protein